MHELRRYRVGEVFIELLKVFFVEKAKAKYKREREAKESHAHT